MLRINRRFGAGLLFILGLAIALVLRFPTGAIAQTVAAAEAPTELRGVWLTNVDSEVLFTRRNLNRAVRRLEQLNFNTLYPTVWNSGYTLYPSAVAEAASGVKVDPYPGLAERDMLAEAVELGHQHGFAVIPWFEFGLMAPAESELVQRHPDWVTSRKDGTQEFPLGELTLVWLNPMHPEVQQFLVDLIAEAVTKYDIDGIQFDDHFGLASEFGYDPYTIDLYKQDHQGKAPPLNSQDPEWLSWRAHHVTDLMVRIYSTVKTRKPNCLVSLSPNPKEFAYEVYLQDWWNWERLKFLDEVIVQVYRTDLERFLSELDRPELKVSLEQTPVSIGILTGLRVLPVETQQVIQQVRMTRDRKYAGMSFFFYETLGDRDEVFKELFPTPVARPDLKRYRAA
jgi:uncharacterized lipoprotein YddW (UPF0748 family)